MVGKIRTILLIFYYLLSSFCTRMQVSLQSEVVDFIRSSVAGPDFSALFRRLAATPAHQLPSPCGQVRLKVECYGSAPVEEEWLVCNKLCSGAAAEVAAKAYSKGKVRMIPWCGVAAMIRSSDETQAGAAAGGKGNQIDPSNGSGRGQAFCFLPLPIPTGAFACPLNVFLEIQYEGPRAAASVFE